MIQCRRIRSPSSTTLTLSSRLLRKRPAYFSNPQSKCAHAKFCRRLCLCADKNMAQCVSTGFSKSRRARGWWNAFPGPDSNLNSNEPLLPSLASTQQAKTNVLIQRIPKRSYLDSEEVAWFHPVHSCTIDYPMWKWSGEGRYILENTSVSRG